MTIPTCTFELAEKTYTRGPLTIGEIEQVIPMLQASTSTNALEVAKTFKEVLVMIMKKKYPKFKVEDLQDAFLFELKDAIDQITAISGLKKPGEAKAEQPAS